MEYTGQYELELYVYFYIFIYSTNAYRPDGTRFTAPAAPGLMVLVGDVVTFTYSFSKNEEVNELVGSVHKGWIPLDPVIVRTRKDVFWEEIIADHGIKPRERNANCMSEFSLSAL